VISAARASRRLKGRILRLSTCLAAVAAAVITLSNHFIQGVTPEQQVQFYLPVVLGQCLFVVLALYTLSSAYLRPVFHVLDDLADGREIEQLKAARARKAAFNYPLDMLLFLALSGIGMSLIFHASEWLFFYKGNIPANWWLITYQNAVFEVTMTVALGMLFFALSRGLMREPLEITTGLTPDGGKRLAIRSRLLITIVSLVLIATNSFLFFYLAFSLAGKLLPLGLFLADALLVTVFCIVIGIAGASDSTRDIVLVTGSLEEIAAGVKPGRHQTLAVTSLDEVGDLVVAFNRLQQRVAVIYRDVDRELELARSVQAELLPRCFPAVPGWEIAGRSLPARQVGGDFYDYVPLSGGRFGLAVGDAAGKGMPAALLMAAVIGVLRAEAPREESPAAVLSRVNRLICGAMSGGMFVIALYAVFDPAAGACTLSSAGHLSPVKFFPDGAAPELVDLGALPLGIERDMVYREVALTIPPGGGVAFYSDGIVEARNETGELFGFDRFLKAFDFYPGRKSEEFISDMMDRVTGFAGSGQEDDMTLLVVRRVGNGF
jgi:serine phosphatase RsbU (regulator of sigma subunit)